MSPFLYNIIFRKKLPKFNAVLKSLKKINKFETKFFFLYLGIILKYLGIFKIIAFIFKNYFLNNIYIILF